MIKKYQGAKMEEIQAKSQSQSHKNRMVRFRILEGPVFLEQIVSD
jgi:hypothetical protein